MKPDQNFINRLEVGDSFTNSNGEICKVDRIDQYSIHASTVRSGQAYYRPYDKSGNGTPASGSIKTP